MTLNPKQQALLGELIHCALVDLSLGNSWYQGNADDFQRLELNLQTLKTAAISFAFSKLDREVLDTHCLNIFQILTKSGIGSELERVDYWTSLIAKTFDKYTKAHQKPTNHAA